MLLRGLCRGALLLPERALPTRKDPAFRLLYRIFTLIIVMAGWAVFACEDLTLLGKILAQTFAQSVLLCPDTGSYLLSFLPLLCICVPFCVPAVGRIRLPSAVRVPLPVPLAVLNVLLRSDRLHEREKRYPYRPPLLSPISGLTAEETGAWLTDHPAFRDFRTGLNGVRIRPSGQGIDEEILVSPGVPSERPIEWGRDRFSKNPVSSPHLSPV